MRRVVLAVALLLAGCTTTPSAAPSASPAERRERDPSGVMVHLFQWPWADVGRECQTVLGPAGVAGVQISPPQEHVVLPDRGYPWWQDYQPTGYRIEGRRGNREAFAAMVKTCHDAGVKVYADAVINHRRGGDPGDYHHCGRSISNYQDRFEVQTCDLVGLPDLATGKPEVRQQLAAYLNDLLDLGVDGFRIDAAKHMAADDVRAIVGLLDKPALIYSEVLYSPAEPIQPTEYRDFGATLEPRYAEKLARTFRSDSFTLLPDRLTDLLPSRGSVVYVDSHDTQRGSSTLSYKEDTRHTIAVQFMLAHPYGTPLLMSSFAFEGFDDGPPAASDGTTLPVDCAVYICEHRRVLEMVKWRNRVGDAPLEHWWATDNELGFARAGRGYFALNRAAIPITKTVQTGLEPGRYTDVLSGTDVTVDASGNAVLTIPATTAVALLRTPELSPSPPPHLVGTPGTK